MKQIFCIGEALIDMICTDKGVPLSEGENFLKKAGGAPTNVAAAIASLGGKVAIAAKVGKDPFGKHLIETMKAATVDTRWMLEDADHFTTMAFVSLMENGERDFVFNRGADGMLSREDLQELNVNDYSLFHFGSATAFLPGHLQSAYIELLETAKQAGLPVSFDPNYRHLLFPNDDGPFVEQSWRFLKACDFFKVSDEEAQLLTRTSSIEDAAADLMKNTEAVFAITLGKEGTLLRFKDQLKTVTSIPVNPVDTTGAGDAFIGAVLYQLNGKTLREINSLELQDWEKIVANANKAGARTCEYMGAMEAFRHLNNEIFN